MIANVIVILGALQFAKDAPKLIENLFGSNGSIKWKIKDKLNENEYAKRAASGVGTIGGNLAKDALHTIANTHHADKGTKLKTFLSSTGRNLTRLPGNVLYGAYKGVSNGNVNLNQLGDAVTQSMGETDQMFQRNKQRKESRKETIREQFGDAAADAIHIPGLGSIIYGLASASEFAETKLKGGAWIDELVEKFNQSRVVINNASNAYNAFSPAAEYINKGIKDIEEAQKKANQEAMNTFRAAYTAAGNDAAARAQAIADYNNAKKNNDKYYDELKAQKREENLVKYEDTIKKILSMQSKTITKNIQALSEKDRNDIFAKNSEIKNIDQLVDVLNKNNVKALNEVINSTTATVAEKEAARKEIQTIAKELAGFGKSVKDIKETSSSIYSVQESVKNEKKDKK